MLFVAPPPFLTPSKPRPVQLTSLVAGEVLDDDEIEGDQVVEKAEGKAEEKEMFEANAKKGKKGGKTKKKRA